MLIDSGRLVLPIIKNGKEVAHGYRTPEQQLGDSPSRINDEENPLVGRCRIVALCHGMPPEFFQLRLAEPHGCCAAIPAEQLGRTSWRSAGVWTL